MKLLLRGKFLSKREPWALQADGDLWEAMKKLIKIEGRHSTRISWVKAHAQQEHIDQGLTTQQHPTGNDDADKLANQRVDSKIQGLSHIANLYLGKQHVATKFLQRICAIFHRVLAEEH